MNLRRLIISVYILLFVGAAVPAGLFFMVAKEEYKKLKVTEMQNEQRLADAQAKLAEDQRILERLKTDPGFVQQCIEKQLGYVKPESQVYRFVEH